MVKYAYDIMDRVTNIAWRTTSGAAIDGFGCEYDAAERGLVARTDPDKPMSPRQEYKLA